MLFSIFFAIMFTTSSLGGIYFYIVGKEDDLTLLITLLILLVFMLMMFRSMITPMRKLFSNKPELIITKDYIQVFDNPKFDKIPFNDIMGLDIIDGKSASFLRIYLLESTKVYSKVNRRSYNINLNVPKVAFININFADIPHDKLKRIIYERIEE